MHLNGFDYELPAQPKLRKPHAFVTLRPWIDVGSVGRLAFRTLERHFDAKNLATLSRPGIFFDFTRYRPNINTVNGKREVTIPNVNVRYAKGPGKNDFVFLHLLEPHLNSESYVKCVVKLLKDLKIERYCLLGSMYDLVPHTKPILVTGSASNNETAEKVKTYGVTASNYEGPTSILTMINQQLNEIGIETMGLIAHLPQYAQTDVNHAGRLRLLNIICDLYNFSLDLERIEIRAKQQNDELSAAMIKSPEVRALVEQLELQYDKQNSNDEKSDYTLSPEIEDFLDEIGGEFSQN